MAEGACRRVLRVLRPPLHPSERELPAALSLGGKLARAPAPGSRSDWAALGVAVQVDSLKTRVESASGVTARK